MGEIAIKHARFSALECTECEKLRPENARLVALLEAHGIDWRLPKPAPVPPVSIQPEPSRLSTDEKIAVFRRLFRGRTDVYPIRWESKAGKSGYAPACANEWRASVCEKPRIKCSDCGNRLLIPLSDAIIYDHLAGEHTIGVYPLLPDDRCYFLAVDFDEADWRDDARAFVQSCRELSVPVALEVSRLGNGAHAWIFSHPASRRGMPGAWARRSSATPAPHAPIEAHVLRPAVPQSGHHAERRLRKSDRIAATEKATREGLQRVRG